MNRDPSTAPSPPSVQAELERVLASPTFEASDRNRRFLRYVVEETLAGRGDRIKAYAIATTVFGRGADFDPQLDSIVRIEAGRLRRALERYYLTGGQADPIVISIPKGCYVPEFVAASDRAPETPRSVAAPTASPARPNRGPSILVTAFEEEGDPSAFPNLARGFTRQVIAGLTRFTEVAVYGPDAPAPAVEGRSAVAVADFLLTGGIGVSRDRLSVEVLLMDARSGRYLWGDVFDRPLDRGVATARDELAGAIVRALAQPYGVLLSCAPTEDRRAAGNGQTGYASVVLFHRYLRTYDQTLFEPARRALERTIEEEPDYAEAFACLSQLYSYAVRFGLALSEPDIDPAERAIVLARRAIELAPNASRGHHALARAYWFTGEVRGSLEEIGIARTLNPNDTGVLADAGLQYALLADWARGIPLLETAFAENPGLPSTYRVGFALFHFAEGRFDEALAEARKIEAPNVVYGFMMEAAAAWRLGLADEARAGVNKVLAIDPLYDEHIRADLAKRHVHPDLIDALAEAFHEAGRLVPPGRDPAASGRAVPFGRRAGG